MGNQVEENKRKQQFLLRNGVNVKVDGSWGPWQQAQYNKLTTKEKPYQTTPLGLLPFAFDKLTGNSTYQEDPPEVKGYDGEIKSDDRSNTRRWVDQQMSNNRTPLGYVTQTVLPTSAVAAAVTYGAPVLYNAVTKGAPFIYNGIRTAASNTAAIKPALQTGVQTVKQNMKRFNLYEMYKGGGAIPIGTQEQYNNVVSIYQSLVSKGVPPQAALEIVNQKVAEKGWTGFATGDNKKYFNSDDFADHIIDWHGRMYPDSLKAKSFEDYWKGIQITPKYKYNSENPNYKQELLKTRSGVKKRINFYRQQQGLNPLAYVPILDMEKTNIT